MTSLKKAQASLGFLMAIVAIGTVVLVSRPAPEPIERLWFWVGVIAGPLAIWAGLRLFIGLEQTRLEADGEGWIGWGRRVYKMWRCSHPQSSLRFVRHFSGAMAQNGACPWERRFEYTCSDCGATVYLEEKIEASHG